MKKLAICVFTMLFI